MTLLTFILISRKKIGTQILVFSAANFLLLAATPFSPHWFKIYSGVEKCSLSKSDKALLRNTPNTLKRWFTPETSVQTLFCFVVFATICPILVYFFINTNYLQGRSQRVVIQESVSGNREVESGVPQGSILGPPLFVLFTTIYSYVSVGLELHCSARSNSGMIIWLNSANSGRHQLTSLMVYSQQDEMSPLKVQSIEWFIYIF